ncbi:MAG: hypothetical protein JXM73_13790, partial [Anaerolineae bacterium]|nr:hypothetical protein [Anaerolineae bacterium]
EQALEPAVLLYGRSWAYEPGSHTPILGDAATWLFWPDRAPAGALAGITVWPQDAVVDAGQQRLFNASGHDAAGYYVPITPTWEATGGSISAVGRYTAGDLPGNYTVRATHEMFAGQVQVTVSGTVTCPDLAAGVSWSHTFAVAGAYPYHDRASPDHTGTVVVNPTTTGQTCSLTTGLNPGPSNTTYDVSITAAGFDPPTVTIGLGDTVRWTNHDTVPHAVDGGESRRYTVYLPLVLRTSPAH